MEKLSLGHMKCEVRKEMGGREIVENVSNLNGIMVTMVYEQKVVGPRALKNLKARARKSLEGGAKWLPAEICKSILCLPSGNLSFPEGFVDLAIVLESIDSKTTHRYAQIEDRAWMERSDEERICQLFSSWCGKVCDFEKQMLDRVTVRGIILEGRLDILDHSRKWITEVKFVEHITASHKLQALLYYYLAIQTDRKKYESYKVWVLNVRDGKAVQIIPPGYDDLMSMVDYLVYRKIMPRVRTDDDSFLAAADKLVCKYFPV